MEANVRQLLQSLIDLRLPNGDPFLHLDLQAHITTEVLPNYTFSIAVEGKDVELKVVTTFYAQLKREQDEMGKLGGVVTTADIKVDRQLAKTAYSLLLSPLGLFTAGHLPFFHLHPLLPVVLSYMQAESSRYRRSLKYCLVALQNEHSIMGKSESLKPMRKLLERVLQEHGFVDNGKAGILRVEWFHRWVLARTER